MEKQYVKYKGKKYLINEPTIEDWARIMVLQQWSDEREFATYYYPKSQDYQLRRLRMLITKKF
jgi:hypothetical protein